MQTSQTTANVRYIQSALNKGFSATQIAQALGISDSAVSQIISTNSLSREATNESATQLLSDTKKDQLEDLLLHKLFNAVALQADLPATTLSKILSQVNGLKRRSAGEGAAIGVGLQTPTVTLNVINAHRFISDVKLDSHNQIIEVAGTPMISANSKQLSLATSQLRVQAASNNHLNEFDL